MPPAGTSYYMFVTNAYILDCGTGRNIILYQLVDSYVLHTISLSKLTLLQ